MKRGGGGGGVEMKPFFTNLTRCIGSANKTGGLVFVWSRFACCICSSVVCVCGCVCVGVCVCVGAFECLYECGCSYFCVCKM